MNLDKEAFAEPMDIQNAPSGPAIRGLRPAADLNEVREALTRAADCLTAMQHPSGFWCGELEGDSILQSEYILLKFIIEQEMDPRLPKIANYLRRQQRQADGAWMQYPGGKADLPLRLISR